MSPTDGSEPAASRSPGIRLADSNDVPALIKLDPVAHKEAGRRELIAGAIDADRLWILEISDSPVGYGIISHGFFGRSFLELIVVARPHQSSGYGPQLIMFLEGQSRSTDVFTSTNESNVHMQHVLEKLGYESSGIIHNLDTGDPEIVYIKRPYPLVP